MHIRAHRRRRAAPDDGHSAPGLQVLCQGLRKCLSDGWSSGCSRWCVVRGAWCDRASGVGAQPARLRFSGHPGRQTQAKVHSPSGSMFPASCLGAFPTRAFCLPAPGARLHLPVSKLAPCLHAHPPCSNPHPPRELEVTTHHHHPARRAAHALPMSTHRSNTHCGQAELGVTLWCRWSKTLSQFEYLPPGRVLRWVQVCPAAPGACAPYTMSVSSGTGTSTLPCCWSAAADAPPAPDPTTSGAARFYLTLALPSPSLPRLLSPSSTINASRPCRSRTPPHTRFQTAP